MLSVETAAPPAREPDTRTSRSCLSSVVVVTAALVAGCSTPPPSPPPIPVVDVVTIATAPVQNIVELPGRIQAVRTAEVRARVDGILERRLYTEGSDVRAGQPLFRIDPRERRADYEAALATLARSKATAVNAAQVVARYQPLVAKQAVSKQEYDAAIAQARSSLADVANAKAQADRALLTLNYTDVRAPIAGRAGRAEVTEGALVSGSAATLLTKIEQLDPIYVNFSQSSGAVLELRRQVAAGRIRLPDLSQVEVTLTLEDGSKYPGTGHLNFADMAVDQATGTVSLRAQFRNAQRFLLPGQFIRARIEAGTNPLGISVPARAVVITDKGASVMLVGPKNLVTPQPIQLGQLDGGKWVVASGLKPGDRVIVDGLQKAMPGKLVTISAPGERRVPTPGDADQSAKR